MMMDSFETWAAAAAAVIGGGLVKVVDKLLSKRSEAFNESQKIRDELRLEIDSLRDQLDRYKKELEAWKEEADEWRAKYWEQVEQSAKVLVTGQSLTTGSL